MKLFTSMILLALFLAPAAHAYDKAKCSPIMAREHNKFFSCVDTRCADSAGENWEYWKRTACMNSCAEDRSEKYQGCYYSMMVELSKLRQSGN